MAETQNCSTQNHQCSEISSCLLLVEWGKEGKPFVICHGTGENIYHALEYLATQ